LLLSPAPGIAQSLGEVARQERERREKLKRHATRVLTNEDLAKPQILDPLDNVSLVAAPAQQEPLPPDVAIEMTVAGPVSAESLGVGLPAGVNLGEVARYYQLKKLLGEEAFAARLRPSVAMPVTQAAATAPTIELAPLMSAAAAPPADQFQLAPGTPAGIVLGDVARSYSQQKALRLASGTMPQESTAAPEVPALSPRIAPAAIAENTGVAGGNPLVAPSLPAATARPAPPAVSVGAGIPPDISLGDLARQLRQPQTSGSATVPAPAALAPASDLLTLRVLHQPRVQGTPALPDATSQPAAVTPESRAPSALAVFAAPTMVSRPQASHAAESRRQLRVVKLSEADIVAATTLVEVKRGDSLWRLAAQHLGSGRRWKEIHASNPEIRNPHLIRVGDVVRVPHQTLAERRREFDVLFVRPGDTLWGLAALQFGRGEAWNCIARVNPQLRDPDVILPGQELILPENCSEAL
jgi:nucleoid-associated protein YgaU